MWTFIITIFANDYQWFSTFRVFFWDIKLCPCTEHYYSFSTPYVGAPLCLTCLAEIVTFVMLSYIMYDGSPAKLSFIYGGLSRCVVYERTLQLFFEFIAALSCRWYTVINDWVDFLSTWSSKYMAALPNFQTAVDIGVRGGFNLLAVNR